ncbi:MAG TPA: TetR/AcrR family transcriptional regulator [Acidimicrobiales bacterium]|nr:TetR/AcrR family transcriptional regulator [Acidimicrobiales bacterium]
MTNAILNSPADETSEDVADRIARQTLSRRGADYATEVRRLLDAARSVMRKCGTQSRPRVSDIVTEAGLSNEAFYRHFRSKDALVSAILDHGAQRLRSYLAHQMAKERTPEGRVRRWVAGVLSQSKGDVAATTLAVMWNGGSAGEAMAAGRHFASAPVAELLEEPFTALGSNDPVLHASLAAHATLGLLSDHLWQHSVASVKEVEAVTEFCLRAVGRQTTKARRA